MERARLIYLIQKLRSGEIAPDEQDELESYWLLAQNDDTLFNSLSGEERNAIRANIFDGIQSKIGTMKKQQPVSRSLFSETRWMLGMAAAVTLILVLALYQTGFQGGENKISTAYGEHMNVALPDGSAVVINGNSTIRFDAEWATDADREIWVDGEAFFEVVHTKNDNKFVVHTDNGMDVQVLGTKFNVKTRRGKTEVMLQEGKVRLDVVKDEGKETMTLQPGELATLDDRELMKVKIKPNRYASWKDNKLFFDQTPLRDIALILEDTYGIRVVFESDEIADRKLSGEIASDDAEDILKAIQETLDVNITREGQHALFHL